MSRASTSPGVTRPAWPLCCPQWKANVSASYEVVPNAALIGVLLNPAAASYLDRETTDVQEAARVVGQQLLILRASTEEAIEAAFAIAVEQRAGGLLVAADPFFVSRREQIVALATRYAIPAIYEVREYAAAGGLMTYGTNIGDAYHQVGSYVGRILKGEKPANLPVLQPTKFEFVINLTTAKALGVAIPPGLLSIADEVIE